MESIIAVVTLSIALLLAGALLPSKLANGRVHAFRQWICCLVGMEFLFSLILLGLFVMGDRQVLTQALIPGGDAWGFRAEFYLDGATVLMLPLVSFVGLVVSRFSIRYLDGEAIQGRYFRWLGVTIGAVSLMVIAGNLLLFFVAWVATSSGLHQLLMHYRERPAARRAAWTKFAISRLGDLFLIGALLLIWRVFGTLQLSEIFAQAETIAANSEGNAATTLIGWLLALGAVTKSAQFPFHIWLPETMETPTPVSALMHAGVVNAGGFLMIRMSPLMALAPSALVGLALVGGLTACFAGVVMMTQSSVKRSLAYSTIAQMGFMMLQCGLGAFSAAMLHIIAHSLYKAHAFLSSGSVLSQAAGMAGAAWPRLGWRLDAVCWLGAALVSVLAFFTTSWAIGLDIAGKPGALVLVTILCLALTTWAWRLYSKLDSRSIVLGTASVFGLSLAYLGSYQAMEWLLGPAAADVTFPPAQQVLLTSAGLLFAGLFALHLVLSRQEGGRWLPALRVHAANGFYVDAMYQRVVASLTGL